jgi:hypothetical protein
LRSSSLEVTLKITQNGDNKTALLQGMPSDSNWRLIMQIKMHQEILRPIFNGIDEVLKLHKHVTIQ